MTDSLGTLFDWHNHTPLHICICGGGSLAHAVAAVLGRQSNLKITLLTRKPALWSKSITLVYKNEAELTGRLSAVSDDPAKVVRGAKFVILAVPHMARDEVLKKIAPFIGPETWLGGFPGFGGLPWSIKRTISRNVPILGLQRVPYVRSTLEYGQAVLVNGVRPRLFVATLPQHYAYRASAWIERLFNIPASPLKHYTSVCLSNSNPIYHPARLYAMWKDDEATTLWQQCPRFYEDWDDTASDIYYACDRELRSIAQQLHQEAPESDSLLNHFRVDSVSQITQTIRNIYALRSRAAPMKRTPSGWSPDLNSYYFTEDIPYGIVTQRALAELADVETPVLDTIIHWAQRWMGKTWLHDGRLRGKDAHHLPLPQNAGIHSAAALRAWLSNNNGKID